MANKERSLRQKFAMYAGAGVIGAFVPFVLTEVTVSTPNMDQFKHELIVNKVRASVYDQMKQAVVSAEASTTSSYSFNIQAQQTLDMEALNKEAATQMADLENARHRSNIIFAPFFTMMAMSTVFVASLRRRQMAERKDGPQL